MAITVSKKLRPETCYWFSSVIYFLCENDFFSLSDSYDQHFLLTLKIIPEKYQENHNPRKFFFLSNSCKDKSVPVPPHVIKIMENELRCNIFCWYQKQMNITEKCDMWSINFVYAEVYSEPFQYLRWNVLRKWLSAKSR